MHEARRSTRNAVAALALLAATDLPARASGGDEPMESVREVLRLRWPDSPRAQEQVVAELAQLGQGAIPALFGVYTGERIDELFQPDDPVGSWWTSPDRFGPLVNAALLALPSESIVDALAPVATGDGRIELRLAAARILGEVAAEDGLGPLLAMTSDLGPLAIQYRSVRSTLEEGIGNILAHEVEFGERTRELAAELDDDTLSLLVDACESSGRVECLSLLASALDRGPALEAQALVVCAELAAHTPWRDPIDAPSILRERLKARDPRVVRAAAAGLGELHDPQAIPLLLELFRDSRPGVEDAAVRALRRMSGTDLGRAELDWTAWTEWSSAEWEREWQELQSDLERGSADRARAAIRRLAIWRLRRHEASEILGAGLERPEPDLRRLARLALRELGSPTAAPALVGALEGADDDEATGLYEALEVITGEVLPREPAAWLERVERG